MFKPLSRSCLVLIVLSALAPVGCVSQAERDRIEVLYRRSQEQVETLKAQLEECEARVRALQSAHGSSADLAGQLARAQADRQALARQLAQLEEQVRRAGAMGVSALPTDLNNELIALAEQNPGLMSYDPAKGLIRLETDVTFALGSANVRPEAAGALQKLARIVNGPSALPYELRIIGHTDNVPVTNPANRQKFGDNWGLSAFRAIAVREVLEKAGVSPTRAMIGGYGEYRPVVPNAAGRRGEQRNRRVEIYLAPNTSAVAAEPADQAPAAPAITPAASGTITPSSDRPASRSDDNPAMFK